MFFKIAFRNILKRKIFTFINVFGLGIGLAACILIYLFVQDELSYDKSYPQAEQLYRIAREHGEGGEKQGSASINYALGELAKENLSGIEALTQFSVPLDIKVEHGQSVFREKALFADQDFLSIFGIEPVTGSVENALQLPFQAVITEKIATQLFGEDYNSAIGKALKIDGRDYTIKAVVKDLPAKSHFHFDYLLSLESTKSFFSQENFEHWGNVWLYTYLRLPENQSVKAFEENLNTMTFEHGPPVLKDFGVRFFVQPVTDIHLYSQLGSELEQNGDIQLLRVLIAVALLILVIACFNFINLTTARSAWRAKEVGVKKVFGVRRPELIRQFLGESLLTTSIALGVSLVLVLAVIPFFNEFTNKSMAYSDLLLAIPFLILIILLVGLVAGAFPSFVLSALEPIKMLKGRSSQGDSFLASLLRKVLIIFQFSISMILIIGALVIFQQLNFIKSKDLGANIDEVMVVPLNSRDARSNKETLVNEFSRIAGVQTVSLASDVPFEKLNSWRIKPMGVETPHELISVMAVDEKYLASLDMQLSSDSPEQARQLREGNQVLVNEAFVKHFLITDPIGQVISIDHLQEPVEIAGVVKNFHYESLHQSIRPLLLKVREDWFQKVVVKFNSSEKQQLLSQLQGIWEQTNPGESFDFYFLKDKYDSLYATEEKTANLVGFFSALSILIACLGLYGLAAYVAETKIREISVRKVLGASTQNLVKLQFDVFTKLILVACVLALPAGYFLMDGWLQNFAYRVDIAWWVMVVALLVVLIFTVLSVGYRSLSAAQTNPINNLRNE